MSFADRAALLAQVSSQLDPAGQAQLATLDKNGTLDKLASDGKTVLQALATMAGTPVSAAASQLGFTTDSLLAQTVGDLADPGSIQQTGGDDCVLSNLRYRMAQDKPGDYVEFATQLYGTGQATIAGGGTIQLSSAVKPFNIGGDASVYYDNGVMMVQNKNWPPMTLSSLVTKLANDPAEIETLFKKNKDFDIPIVHQVVNTLIQMWNNGEQQQVTALAMPLISAYISSKPTLDSNAGLKYLADHYHAVFQPSSQLTTALPTGIPLDKIASYYGGLSGYQWNDASQAALSSAVDSGAQVPMVFKTDDGLGLHLETIIGRDSSGNYIAYDPESGPHALSSDVFKNQAVAIFLPSSSAQGLSPIDPNDTAPVGGGRVGMRGAAG